MNSVTWTETIEQWRPFMEITSFAATILLGILGIFVLAQLKLARESLKTAQKDIQTRIEREAIILAAEQCTRFAKEIIPLYSQQTILLGSQQIVLQRFKLANTNFDRTTMNFEDAKKWNELIGAQNSDRFIEVLNLTESFAMYFVGGAAKEEVAYPSVGNVFCGHIEHLAPLLVLLREEGDLKSITSAGPYQNLIKLYAKWSARLEDAQIGRDVGKLLTRQAEIDPSPLPVHGEVQSTGKARR